ncbi:hypothetical protein COV42_01910 [Candidatus Campbellbacteria bacterium CG11_big_fil_rev_8_21_14_0_20_44_21]|uniref:Uncharacterized protein n=1 Tax=Candidatus Campbellbacteria bacterium CG22_combo_CG10-13_8_21_14_all_43_18 TaxID=1974530 RepID=A0A2H0DVX5_9BACT|nr:MAG: hypothetical protein COW82_02445 [Candidatus Campbellbacteria bacterium CG22_combo_CG10-13_8_21_14_all_43_18]PIR24183.1 MAG: hypothetical protein COV42_01910 [Candidatus Campbellbacteria bacterium CG11_big_fil_rev_8_21_14_0_20_44_21]
MPEEEKNEKESEINTSPAENQQDGEMEKTPNKMRPFENGAAPRPLATKAEGRTLNKDLKGTKKKTSIRTYADDVAGLIKSGTSLSDIAMAEGKKRAERGEQKLKSLSKDGKSRSNRFFIVFSVILFALGMMAVLGSLFFRKSEKGPEETGAASSIIFANSFREIDISALGRIELLKKINQERNSAELPLGAISNLLLEREKEGIKAALKADEFLNLLEVRAGEIFIRSLEKDFMLGAHSFDGNQGFLLFRVKSFDKAFGRMIAWEKFMLDDLWPMFYNSKPSVEAESSSVFEGKFKDIVLRNRDARILEDDGKGTALVYSFPDQRHLVITTDKSTLIEVFERLSAGRFKN